jgi:hypothetical protein
MSISFQEFLRKKNEGADLKDVSVSFQDFLRKRTEGSDVRERRKNREEWLDALNRLFHQIQVWLREVDTEELLEIIPYQVQSMERRLGIHDEPALKVGLGTSSVNIAPVGRFSIGPIGPMIKGLLGVVEQRGGLGGRVDLTNGERKYLLCRWIDGSQDRWYIVDQESRATHFDRDCLEVVLQDLLS